MSVIEEQSRELDQEVNHLFICLYTNSSNETKVQTLRNARKRASGNTYYIQGWSEGHQGVVTLRADRINAVFSDAAEAEEALGKELSDSAFLLDLPEGKPINHKHGAENTFDIHFTGFSKKKKEELEKTAVLNSMISRKSVTKHLNALCCGVNASPEKIALAVEQGVFILAEDDFNHFISTGELPENLSANINDIFQTIKDKARQRAELDKLDKLQEELATSFSGVKTLPRRENLIATFEDDRAVGWKFHVPSVFREALDIRLTPFTIHTQTVDTWTQGHAYSFKVGDSIGSHSTKDWKQFLQQDNAMVLQVKYATPAGFDENKKFEGVISGGFYASKTAKCPTDINGLNIIASSYTYDPGVLTVSIFKPNSDKTKVELFDTLVLDQVEFVTLLQLGYYWQKPESKEDDTPLKKVQLVR
ncbi:hypothetical protein AB6E16_08665 [Vibrio atlanticus]|uniref:hypothetical protein n=1 Tax=Vibrio TaxID=662 RepID=UPI000C832BFA|nr:hypothetical protein [Vibrio lentus]PMI38287.1 hypothetical protein BCU45_06740 [Vibrio lentus]